MGEKDKEERKEMERKGGKKRGKEGLGLGGEEGKEDEME